MIEDEFAGHKQHTRPRARSAKGPDRGVAMHTYVYTYVLTQQLYFGCTMYVHCTLYDTYARVSNGNLNGGRTDEGDVVKQCAK